VTDDSVDAGVSVQDLELKAQWRRISADDRDRADRLTRGIGDETNKIVDSGA